MQFNPGEDFGKNMGKLMSLLKKMLKSQNFDPKELHDLMGRKDINLNLCFFTFFSNPLEEMDDPDMEDAVEGMVNEVSETAGAHEELRFELDGNDHDFLKKNGIKF